MLRWVRAEIPEGTSGDWKVEKFEVDEQGAAFHNLRCAMNTHSRGREIEPGIYTKLLRKGDIVMSDTPAELKDCVLFIRMAEGNILIAGLGLGLVTKALAETPAVDHIVVIERERDVIQLIEPYMNHEKVLIVEGDAMSISAEEIVERSGTKKFDCAFYDIWDNICRDNILEMEKLKIKFKKIVKSGQQFCWCEWECENGR